MIKYKKGNPLKMLHPFSYHLCVLHPTEIFIDNKYKCYNLRKNERFYWIKYPLNLGKAQVIYNFICKDENDNIEINIFKKMIKTSSFIKDFTTRNIEISDRFEKIYFGIRYKDIQNNYLEIYSILDKIFKDEILYIFYE